MYLNASLLSFLIPSLSKRIKAIIFEMWYSLAVFFPYLLLPTLILEYKINNIITSTVYNILLIGIINKDFFNGQSIINRSLGYQVVDARTLQTASKLRCMIRNITAPLWPVEGIFILFNPERRLGDFLAGTKIVELEKSDPELILNEIRTFKLDQQAVTTILLSMVWVTTMFILFANL